jgi:DNA polymerase-3 subunit gamma/tau
MALLRVIHATELPDPGALAESLASGEGVAARAAETPKSESQGALLKTPADFPALVERLATGGKAHLAQQLHDYVGLVRYAPPELALRPLKPFAGDFARDLGAALKGLTGALWQVRLVEEEAQASLLEQEKGKAERLRQEVLESPLVQAAFEAFPDAELAGYTLEQRAEK